MYSNAENDHNDGSDVWRSKFLLLCSNISLSSSVFYCFGTATDLVKAAAYLLSSRMSIPSMIPLASGSISRQISLVAKSQDMNLAEERESALM